MEFIKKHAGFYLAVCAVAMAAAIFLSRAGSAVIAVTASAQTPSHQIVVIDAGHGGEDGGAISCSGARESDINLEISLRLRDLMHFLGIQTRMIRTTDISVYSEGATTIARKKVSDIRNRVKMVEETPNGVLVSIHQNNFPEAQYRGAQVFYADTAGSESLAESTQEFLIKNVDSNNHRKCKRAKDIYLMEHIVVWQT